MPRATSTSGKQWPPRPAHRAYPKRATTRKPIPPTLRNAAGGSLGSAALGFTAQTQPAMDNNSVDLDRERANFVDNAVRYEATLRFINGSSKTILSAIQGQ